LDLPIFDIGSVVFPYAGVNLTPAYGITEGAFGLRSGLDGGILMSMSESVGLDFGLRPEITFKLSERQKWKISMPAGFLGIRAVF
jgi:hypothetical protein